MTISSLSLFSQQLISFEGTEGYVLGNINGQSNWTTTGTGPGTFVTNQVVSDQLATDGVNSLLITKESAFPGQANPIVGAFKALGESVAYNDFTLSFDIRLTQQDANASAFEFQTVGAGPTGGVYVVRVRFTETGSILAAQTVGTSSTFETTTGTWLPNTWYRLKVVGTATGISYYLDGTRILTAPFFQEYNFTDLRFVHDNYGGNGYIDRIAVNNEAALATGNVQSTNSKITVYPNPTSDYLNFSGKVFSAQIFDAAGRTVSSSKVSNGQVNVTNLAKGVYIVKFETENGTQTEKFIKK